MHTHTRTHKFTRTHPEHPPILPRNLSLMGPEALTPGPWASQPKPNKNKIGPKPTAYSKAPPVGATIGATSTWAVGWPAAASSSAVEEIDEEF